MKTIKNNAEYILYFYSLIEKKSIIFTFIFYNAITLNIVDEFIELVLSDNIKQNSCASFSVFLENIHSFLKVHIFLTII